MKPPQGIVGVRVSLEPGLYVTIGLTDAQAKQLIRGWASGDFALKGWVTVGSEQFPGDGGTQWSARLDKIIAINTFSLEAMQAQAQQQAPAPPAAPGGSRYGSGWPG